jgi:hypothetical protein
MILRLWWLGAEAELAAVAEAAGAELRTTFASKSLEVLGVCEVWNELLVALVLDGVVELPHCTVAVVMEAVVTVHEGVAVPTVE